MLKLTSLQSTPSLSRLFGGSEANKRTVSATIFQFLPHCTLLSDRLAAKTAPGGDSDKFPTPMHSSLIFAAHAALCFLDPTKRKRKSGRRRMGIQSAMKPENPPPPPRPKGPRGRDCAVLYRQYEQTRQPSSLIARCFCLCARLVRPRPGLAREPMQMHGGKSPLFLFLSSLSQRPASAQVRFWSCLPPLFFLGGGCWEFFFICPGGREFIGCPPPPPDAVFVASRSESSVQ